MRLTIEDDVFVNQSCHFDMQAPIHIARGARIGDHVRFITSDHEVGPPDRRAGPGRSEPIDIGRGSWICSGATILPGVSVAEGNIVAAGAVVTRSTEANCLYAGVPARLIKRLDKEESAL
ncbi:MAG: acyltransferase [Microbacterium enclense]